MTRLLAHLPEALVFALLALGLVFGAVIPALSVGARLLLDRLDDAPLARASDGRFLLLIAPVGLPLLWLGSAAVHEAEPGRVLAACAHSCADPLFSVGLVTVGILLLALRELRRVPTRSQFDPADTAALRALLARRGHGGLSTRVRVVPGQLQRLRTRGLLWRRIEVARCAFQRLPEEALVAALLHEQAHLQGFDPLRGLLLELCQRLNPAARLLRPHHRSWRLARELVCDLVGVEGGADAFSLADALVASARPHRPGAACCALGGPEPDRLDWLRLRVRLLLDYAEHGPPRRRRSLAWLIALALAVGTVAAPHLGSAGLHQLHHTAARLTNPEAGAR